MSEIEDLKEDLSDLENITDEEEDISTSEELFSISSFGVDYPVETLYNRMSKNLFYIPHFQRKYVWSMNQASRFIESLLLGLPVPGIFLFKEAESGRHLVIDGQQRLKSILYFYNGLFNGKEFKLSGLNSKWSDLSYKTLDDSDRARLNDAVIHATVFKQDLPQNHMNSVYEVFERINTGGTKLSPQEIRSCIYHGSFNKFLHQLNENSIWRDIYGPKSKRLKDVELLLRFFAFYEKGNLYYSPMKKFLNDFMDQHRNATPDQLDRFEKIFLKTIEFIKNTLGEKAFRPDRSLNTAVFDSACTMIAKLINSDLVPDPEVIRNSYNELLRNDRYIEGYVRSTADVENVRKRLDEARRAFGVS